MKIMKPTIYLVVPKLIEQPTWGGTYILKHKGWANKSLFNKLIIGQSYELFSGTNLRNDIDSSLDQTFTGQLGYAMEPDKILYKGDKTKLIPIDRLIKQDAIGFLGEKVLKRHGPTIKILIKFTQAKGNSYQIHVREKDQNDRWRFKAESWLYFEPGLLTMGIKKDTNWEQYYQACLTIDRFIDTACQKIKNNTLSYLQAKKNIQAMMDKTNLKQYVNFVNVRRNELIDNSLGGVHHSWEEDNQKYPLGNVLYELCTDVMDPISTLRSFDQGKITPNGDRRPLNIQDYFQYIDRNSPTNNPASHIVHGHIKINKPSVQVKSLLATPHYMLDVITLKNKYQIATEESYHHLFIKSGLVDILSSHNKLRLSKGHSCFIPSNIQNYQLVNVGQNKAEILKTFID
jgi:mannose-6-phosphate isomerase-like protein (cupin superfamily)